MRSSSIVSSTGGKFASLFSRASRPICSCRAFVSSHDWRAAFTERAGHPAAPPGFAYSESPRFVGRGIAALAADPGRARWNQRSVSSAELAAEYGVTDVDGTRPDSWAGRRD